MRLLTSIIALLLACVGSRAQLTYQAEDSIRVESLLSRAASQHAGSETAQLVMFFAQELQGVPYVAKTLEVNSREKLVVNLRELDCTTYVETVLALALTARHDSWRFADYCRWLRKLRYSAGVLDGYASRNHYFSQWITSNEHQGLVTELVGDAADSRGAYYPFVELQCIQLNWMTTHVSSYPMMVGRTAVIERVRRAEQAASGTTVHYIPRRLLNRGKADIGCVHDGDVLAIVTNKSGLDTSHLGFAVWGSDGQLHLLNASQIHKKVVLEPMTLATYMSKHPTQLGVRAVRLKP